MGGSSKSIRLVRTGFKEFDEYLVGGFPRPGMVYVIGNPGVGKTTFALQYLVYRGVQGERGLYVTTSEPISSIKTRYTVFNFYRDFTKLLESNIILVHEFLPVYGQTPETVHRFIKTVFDSVRNHDIKNIIIDSIAGLTQYLSLDEIRTVFTQLIDQTYDAEITLTVIDELPLFAKVPHLAMGEFLSDVLIMIDHVRSIESGKVFTRFMVIKSRVSSALREPIAVQVTPEEGFQFIGPLTGRIEKLV